MKLKVFNREGSHREIRVYRDTAPIQSIQDAWPPTCVIVDNGGGSAYITLSQARDLDSVEDVLEHCSTMARAALTLKALQAGEEICENCGLPLDEQWDGRMACVICESDPRLNPPTEKQTVIPF